MEGGRAAGTGQPVQKKKDNKQFEKIEKTNHRNQYLNWTNLGAQNLQRHQDLFFKAPSKSLKSIKKHRKFTLEIFRILSKKKSQNLDENKPTPGGGEMASGITGALSMNPKLKKMGF